MEESLECLDAFFPRREGEGCAADGVSAFDFAGVRGMIEEERDDDGVILANCPEERGEALRVVAGNREVCVPLCEEDADRFGLVGLDGFYKGRGAAAGGVYDCAVVEEGLYCWDVAVDGG